MARPRKRENNGLPQNLLCRRRRRANGKIVEYFYYVVADGKEKSLGTNKYEAVLEAAKLNLECVKKTDVMLFIEVVKRYEVEILPSLKKNTKNTYLNAIRKLLIFFGDPPAPLDKIKPNHIKQYLQWRKHVPQSANIEIAVFQVIWNSAREWNYTTLPSPSDGIKKFPKQKRTVYAEDFLLDKIREFSDQNLIDILDIAYLTSQRPVDVCNIHQSHIYNGLLHITQKKTGQKVRFEITGKLKEIIERRSQTHKNWLFINQKGRG